ncbi:hypothetical protein AZE42_06109 [Rhizopogon vesiculosus]|uniref:Fe2OG dioxygenase domain-containing protein n=1 Tax=Rhizopogon vesiculosus TaxID=180088 RepID=A0A1J8PWB2_9AGAM|nr:hypothetical protein AZE42_06109 [Rhizopogon vesiculosus]
MSRGSTEGIPASEESKFHKWHAFDPSDLTARQKQSAKEYFDIGRDNCSRVSNVWLPEQVLPGFRDAASAFFNTCHRFELQKLLPALSLGLGLPGEGEFLGNIHREGENQMRLLHYPAVPAESEMDRIDAHTDFGTCTMLFQDDVGGLEVESPSGSGNFVPAPPIPGTVVFNTGDLLMRWSNDTLKSTLHRVRAPPNDGTGMIKERFSIPYFMDPDRDILVDCLPNCWAEDKPKKYEPVTAGAYVDMRIDDTEIIFPIIDFARFEDGTSPARTTHDEAIEIGRQLVQACREGGFAYFLNTGIRQVEVDSMFEWSRRLFSLPNKTKMLAAHPKEAWKDRGYTRFGREQSPREEFDPSELAAIRKPNAVPQESFDIGRDNCLVVSNVWLPEEVLPGFRDSASAFFNTCLGLPGGGKFLGNMHGKGDNQLRLLHYPATPAETFASGERNRLGGHTDFGTCTILFQDDVGGLEVESPNGSGNFVPALPIPGTVVFNTGDLLMRWSNGTLKSTLHRVRAPPNDRTGMIKERFSIPYFIDPDRDILIDCLPGYWDEDKPKKYGPLPGRAHIDMRIEATY